MHSGIIIADIFDHLPKFFISKDVMLDSIIESTHLTKTLKNLLSFVFVD